MFDRLGEVGQVREETGMFDRLGEVGQVRERASSTGWGRLVR